MKKLSRLTFVYLLFFLLLISNIVNANAAAPPRVTVVGSNFPDDLELTAVYIYEDNSTYEVNFEREDKFWETYYRFYDLPSAERKIKERYIVVETGDIKEIIDFPRDSKGYSEIVSLKLKDMSLSKDAYVLRTYILIALRVILTLIIEGAVLYAFGFRDKRTYLAFLIVNLITQGFLNYSFTGPSISYIWWLVLLLSR